MGSVTQILDDLQSSQPSRAQQDLCNLYFERLLGVARNILGHNRRVANEQDVAICALKSFLVGAREQRFPDLSGRDNLWALLVVITERKAYNQLAWQLAQIRGKGDVRGDSVFNSNMGFEQIAGQEPSRERLDEINDEIILAARALSRRNRVTKKREDKLLKEEEEFKLLCDIVRLDLENYSSSEIGEEVGLSKRTVQLRLAQFRDQLVWNDYFQEFSDAMKDVAPRAVAPLAESARHARQKRRYPSLCDKCNLWMVLLVSTGEFQPAPDYDGRWRHIDRVTAIAPTGQFAAESAGKCRQLLESLDASEASAKELREVAMLKLNEYSHSEIAARLDCAEARVEPMLKLIRTKWLR